jgi:hypothetical protein
MLPTAIYKIEELLLEVEALDPQIIKGYDASVGKDSFFCWGVACRIQCTDMAALKEAAELLQFLWLSDAGDVAYTDGLSIDDFQTYRVNGALELVPEEEV